LRESRKIASSPVGEREIIHFREVDEAGAKCLEVRVSGILELRQVVAREKSMFFIVSRAR